MRSGKLRQRITIQRRDDSSSNWGGTSTWGTYATVWASIENMRGKEGINLNRIRSESTHIIIFRYIAGVNNSMRIVFQNKTYDIVFVNEDIKNGKLIIEALEHA